MANKKSPAMERAMRKNRQVVESYNHTPAIAKKRKASVRNTTSTQVNKLIKHRMSEMEIRLEIRRKLQKDAERRSKTFYKVLSLALCIALLVIVNA